MTAAGPASPVTALLLVVVLSTSLVTASLELNEPRLHLSYTQEQLDHFNGNDSYVDFFKLLLLEDSSVLVGSRNVVYNLSLPDLIENQRRRIEWPPTGAHRELCYLKGKSEEDCHNYIRVGARVDDSTLLICGTNAYKPLCREINISEHQKLNRETEGQGRCPYDPNHNSSYIYTDGQLFSATVADFSGVDPLIYRDPLRTERANLKQLNEPNFVSSLTHGDYVLFFFRETAVEYINCGKVIYSRVARVCKKDKGGPHQFSDRWTSFIKARLNCSVPGDFPFYFNEIQSTSQFVEGMYGGEHMKVIYAVFTTPVNSIGGSAVCAFSINDLMKTFDGPFKGQEDMNSNWLRVQSSKVPEPRPGRCVNDSRTLPDVSVNFAKKHSLMDEAVPSLGQPLFVKVSLRNRYTAIAVDAQVKTISGEPMDVVFIGTDEGHVLKGVHRTSGKQLSILIEDIHLSSNSPVTSLSIIRNPYELPKLLVITADSVQMMPLYRCSTIMTCRECVGIQDPYCAWDNQGKACVAHEENAFVKKNLLQNIVRGSHPSCQIQSFMEKAVPGKAREMDPSENDVGEPEMRNCPKCMVCNQSPCTNDEQTVVGTKEKIVIYTADTLGMVVATSVLATLVVGFVAGYFCSRHFRPDTSYSNMPLHSHHPLNRLSESNIHGESASYLSPCANNKAALNLVVNVPPKTANDKNANSSPDNTNKTLPKVKKTYI